MIDYQPMYQEFAKLKGEAWNELLPDQIEAAFNVNSHGSVINWLEIIERLPTVQLSEIRFDTGLVKVGNSADIDKKTRVHLLGQLKAFHPWRKGPYDIFGVHIDTEWRSDWKWERLQSHITPLDNRLVLDVGSGNGYHCWRMLGAGARMVIGVDPLLLNVVQFHVIRKLVGDYPVYVLPVGIEKVPKALNIFDTVFSMGVFYHRRSPIDHLFELKGCLRSKGELILETLIIDGKEGEVLMPEGRYAKMRNVWFLPSCETLLSWMRRCGFVNCRVIDITTTTVAEQRSTEWMQFYSLNEFLDPENPELTCEGLPAPKRAIVIANVP